MRTPGGSGLTFELNHGENEKRLRELILYVVDKCGNDPRFGATKLNKILFYSDIFSYGQFGRPVTGVEYMRLDQGPAPRRLLPVRSKMEKAGELAVSSRQIFNGMTQTKFAALRQADVSVFSAEELALVDEVIEYLRDHTATAVSQRTHGRVWQAACDREAIPYEAVFVSDRDSNERDSELARQLSRKRKWRERFALATAASR